MGCGACGIAGEGLGAPVKEILTDHERFCAYRLPVQEPDFVLTFDFATNEPRIFDISIDPAIDDYTVFLAHPFFFVAGGVERKSKELSKKLWVTSAGEGTVHMASSKNLSEARRKPFLLSPRNGMIYIVGGYKKTGSEYSFVCEKTSVSDDAVTTLRPMHFGYDCVTSVGIWIFALGELSNGGKFECFDTTNEEAGWLLRSIEVTDTEKLISCHTRFGVAGDDVVGRLIIFGGLTNEGKHTSDVYILDGKTGNMKIRWPPVPEAEDFLMPAAIGRQNNYMISRTWKLYVNAKGNGSWISSETSIPALMAQRKLHVK
jgi:hypothetical protein